MGKYKLEMDDFGDLLDELEGELTSAPVGRAPPPGSMSLGQPQCGMPSNKSAGGGDDLDDLLGDFDCAELKCASPAQKVVPVVLPSSSGPPGSKQKCGTVYMGGANDGMGYQDCVGTVCCNKLRCHSCDFPVVVWDNYEWDASADYIFMRYNYPDWEKLQPFRKNGSAANRLETDGTNRMAGGYAGVTSHKSVSSQSASRIISFKDH